MDTLIRCPRCWKHLPSSARFCPRCGSAQAMATPIVAPPAPVPQRRRRSCGWGGSMLFWSILFSVIGTGFLNLFSRMTVMHPVMSPPPPPVMIAPPPAPVLPGDAPAPGPPYYSPEPSYVHPWRDPRTPTPYPPHERHDRWR